MICKIICVDGFLCMSHLDIVHISSVYVHIICILSEHMHTYTLLMVFSACRIWTLLTSHLYVYISSAYYLSICVLCTYYLQWSLISSFLTDNANVIYMSSLLLFIDPMMYNLVSIHCLHKHTLSMPSTCCTHISTLFVMYLSHSLYTLLPAT